MPVDSNTDVTVTTDFTTTSGIFSFTTQVAKTPARAQIDVTPFQARKLARRMPVVAART